MRHASRVCSVLILHLLCVLSHPAPALCAETLMPNSANTQTQGAGACSQNALVMEAVRTAQQQQLLLAALSCLQRADGLTADGTGLWGIPAHMC